MFRVLVVVVVLASAVVLSEPLPCSSPYYHKDGKCGGRDHGFLRCRYGQWCNRTE
jgi:hypothetical protein